MQKTTRFAALAALATLTIAGTANAAPFTETSDAGQSLATAQALAGGTSQILGSVSGDADLFSFNWAGGAFYVNSVGSTGDTQLFLFNSAGEGVLGNDDGISSAGPAYLQLASMAAGVYYLGISGYNYDPYSASGLIFPSSPFSQVFGPSNSDPLSYWSGGSGSSNYVINFQQVTSDGTPVGDPTPTGPSVDVPEPATLSLGALGLLGAALGARRRRDKSAA